MSIATPVEGVFFDLYRTLLVLDDATALRADWLQALQAALRLQGRSVGRDTLAAHFAGFFARPEPADRGQGLSVLERRLGRLADDLGLDLDDWALPPVAEAVVEAWGRHFSLDPEAPALLDALGRRLPLALISNFDHPRHVRGVLAALDLERHFQSVTISSEVGVRKPDPAIFQTALSLTGLEPARVVYLGDSPEDVAGARAAGIRPVLIDRRGGGPAYDDVPVIRSLSELPALVG